MAAPTPRGATPHVSSSSSTVGTATVTLDTHAVGDYLLVYLAVKSVTTVTPPAGWVLIKGGNSGGIFLGCYQQSVLAASNAETNPQFTFSPSATYAAHAYSIPMPNSGTINRAGVNNSSSTSGNADPPSNTSFGGTQDYLWFAAAAVNTSASISAGPSGYSNFTATGTGTNVTLGTAWKQALASLTEDPGAFTNTSGNWNAATLAVWDPVSGGGSTHVASNLLFGIG